MDFYTAEPIVMTGMKLIALVAIIGLIVIVSLLWGMDDSSTESEE
jgi:hypothetical protein